MGLCKCPKRKVTNLFCFEHRVNVCEHCLVSNHPNCVVQSYLNWLQDSDYNPNCALCNNRLDNEQYGQCVRLMCYDLFHWSCLNRYAVSLPATTAPAGYQCPNCKGPIFPPANTVSPVADRLRDLLSRVNWARAGLGLPLTDKQELPKDPPLTSSNRSTTFGSNDSGRTTPSTSDTSISGKPVHPVQPTVVQNCYNVQSMGYSQPLAYSRTSDIPGAGNSLNKNFPDAHSNTHALNMSDHDTDKYKRRPAFNFLSQWFQSRESNGRQSNKKITSTQKKFIVALGIGVIGFLTVIAIFSRLSRSNSENEAAVEQEMRDSLNIRVGDQ